MTVTKTALSQMSRRKTERYGGDIKRRGNVTAQGGEGQRVTSGGDIVTLVASIFYDGTAVCNAKGDKRQGGRR